MRIQPIMYFLKILKSRKFVFSVIFLIFLNTFTSYLSLVPAYLTQIIFDDVIVSFNLKLLLKVIFLLCSFFVVSGILNIFNTLFYVKLLNSSSLKFRIEYLTAYLSKDFNSISNYSEGDIIYRGNNDIQNMCELCFELIIRTFTQLLFLVGILFFMFKNNVLLSSCVITLMLIEYIYNYLSSNKLKLKVDKVKSTDANLLEIYKQIINRYIYIRLNRLQKYESGRFSGVIIESLKNRESYILSQSIISGVTNIISGSRQMIILAIGAYLISKGQLSIGLLIAFNQLVQSLSSPTQFFSNWIHHYKDLLSSFERVEEILRTTKSSRYKVINDPNTKLICENVNFEMNNISLIKNLNMSLHTKEKVAIVGESGSGKSTLCKLIAGLYDYEGNIFMSDSLSPDKTNISFMLDESTLFRGSLWDNLTYGLEDKQKEISVLKEALKKVKLDYLYEQTDGFRSIIDKNILSKGEKQRLEIARIILVKPDLIILDEPTSGLDEDTEKIVWFNLRKECENSTILFTTHKKNIIFKNDRILSISKGGLIEELEMTEHSDFRILQNV
ncbi:ABC transporter ATP-binding protein [Paenibacillus sp. FSL R7-0128]|uniref:ABC transporter ATP-binding protein n=1 Tax=Paenibacillus sp. FSL R7-0128 TaxID=2954529 RepID=UPI0030F7BFE8